MICKDRPTMLWPIVSTVWIKKSMAPSAKYKKSEQTLHQVESNCVYDLEIKFKPTNCTVTYSSNKGSINPSNFLDGFALWTFLIRLINELRICVEPVILHTALYQCHPGYERWVDCWLH